MAFPFSKSCYTTLFLFSILSPGGQATSIYNLDTSLSGQSFFEGFDFYTGSDPTHGFVNFLGGPQAEIKGLAGPGPNGASYMGVDHTTTLSTSGPGRNSVRITSKKSWTHGLFIADIEHMPGGICGTWPAFWMLGPNWPYNGEIDIIEGVNSNHNNLMSLHSSANCTIAGSGQSGQIQSNNCDGNFSYNAGCGTTASTDYSYGALFNAISGGVYATEWTSEYIKIWFFPRTSIPQDITNGVPNPSSWGTPQSNFQGGCDIDSHFASQNIVIDTTFCGDWGNAVWSSDSTCSSKAPTCEAYVAANPSAFTNAYWTINSVKVYQLGLQASLSAAKKISSTSKKTSTSSSQKASSSTRSATSSTQKSSTSTAKTSSSSAKALSARST
ncbi:putative endo-1,3(4)-beta-glucanase, partial [Lachnellula suecica]